MVCHNCIPGDQPPGKMTRGLVSESILKTRQTFLMRLKVTYRYTNRRGTLSTYHKYQPRSPLFS